MKAIHLFAGVAVLAAVGAALAYQATAREEQYRRLLGQGDAALAAADTFGAIEAYSGAIALRPDSMLAHLRRGETYHRRGDLEASARDLRRAASLAPTAPQPLEALGNVFFDRGRFSRAAEIYEERLRLDESSPHIAYRLALARYRTGELDAALAALADTIRLASDLPAAHYLMGVCLHERGQLDEAAAALERALSLAPGLVEAREELADVYRAQRRSVDHLEQLQILAAVDRQQVARQVEVALAQARAGRPQTAVLTLGDALERSPDQPQIHAALGQVWLDLAQRQPDRPDALPNALAAFERAAAASGASSEVLAMYGRALLRSGRADEADAVLQQAIGRYPVAAAALLEFAGLAEQRDQLSAARDALIEYDALVGDALDVAARAARIARLSIRIGDPAAAARWFARALAAGPDSADLLAALAEAQAEAGDPTTALLTAGRGLALDPGHRLLRSLSDRLTRSTRAPTPSSASGR